ncbi:hypothetical protein WOLCODRAFT_29249 [Wolfiporia cocos MD-104 SS10]|uniref:Uncharacterized protein n=1 Tax=Wolfiporia cocos (strain MD-104) TaxID=742152 RepID=A0A2H3J9G6_WOLCO|nr:hypothetical protein WOLCODRAFT_29249 [Wolfiporia cocos MD-104 SS10]
MASRESQEALTSAWASPTGIYSFMQAQEMPGSSRTSSARITLFETASGNPPGDAAPLESSCDISARPDSAVRIQLTEPNAGDKRPAPADKDRTGPRKRIIRIQSAAVASSSVDIPFASIMPRAESTSQVANSVAGRLGRTGGETVTQRNEIEGNSARVKDETDAAQDMAGDGMVLNITPNARDTSAEWKATHPEGRIDEFDKAFRASSKEQL